MSSIDLVLTGIAVAAASGLGAFLFPRGSRAGQALAAALLVAGSALGMSGAVLALAGSGTEAFLTGWGLPFGEFAVGLDALSAFFLVPIFLVPALGALYGLGYWPAREHPADGRKLGLSYGVLAAAMALVAIARDGALFLVAWELMALASWLAATAESHKPEVRKAGWVYLVATHIGTLCLFAMFALLRAETGSFALAAAPGLAREAAGTLFLLALLGFGLKAGLVPLHVWLPGAHANAPSHVSAVMSGVMIKMGIYGLLRIVSLCPPPEEWWGWTLLAAGAVSGIAGIAWSIGQGDLKRALAYSSVENVGIVAMGAGLALLGRSADRPSLVLLGMGGALLHVWNHGLFKSLLFLDAGAVIHATGTRRIDLMGGLARRLPLPALFFALGAVAIAGLPPLNGFVGEWLLYLGFFRGLGAVPGSAQTFPAAAANAAVLATIGALAVAGFVRLFGLVFLGLPRSRLPASAEGHGGGEAGPAMLAPMALLAALCLLAGLAPGLVIPAAGKAAAVWGGLPGAGEELAAIADTGWIPPAGLAVAGIALVAALVLGRGAKRARAAGTPTWDCGYAAPTARMQYTPSSFGDFLGRGLAFVLVRKRRGRMPEGPFPAPGALGTKAPDPLLDLGLRPLVLAAKRALPHVKFLQKGQTQMYLVYVLVATAILLIAGVGAP